MSSSPPLPKKCTPPLETRNSKLETPSSITIDPGPLGTVLEGAIRPTHFRGVCTVVAKLLHIVNPALMFMGQKDYQQQLILKHMVRDLNFQTEIITCPTIREPDGLAMSSRNRYLNPDERRRATALYQSLKLATEEIKKGNADATHISTLMTRHLESQNLQPQYALAANAQTLKPTVGKVSDQDVLLIAAKLGATRLIDNHLIADPLP